MIKSVIGAGSRIVGEFSFTFPVSLQGEIEGNLESKGLVEIASTGLFSGRLSAESLVISGRFVGEAEISGRITINSGARVEGRLVCREIQCEENTMLLADLEVDGLVEEEQVSNSIDIVRAAW